MAVLALLGVVSGCGSDDPEAVPIGGGMSGRSGSGGQSGSAAGGQGGTGGRRPVVRDAGMDAGGGSEPVVDPAAPQIEIVEPTPASDPNEDEILTRASVKVLCRVTRSQEPEARDVNQSSVTIQLIDPLGERQPVDGVVTALTGNEFEADFHMTALSNGPVRFVCAARDVSMPPRTGTGRLDTFLDLGPDVHILAPAGGSSHALRNPVVIRFEVAPAPVSDDDEEADPVDVRLVVLDQEFDAAEDPDQPGLYTASADFNDREIFTMPPTAADIAVIASSSRTPEAPTRRQEVDITLDAVGPSISVSSPAHLSIVRGQIQLVVAITDPSGVQADSVLGTINQNVFVLDDWEVSGMNFTTRFDTRTSLFAPLTQLTLNITAVDNVGNESTVSHVLRLDNVPPLLSLDPPPVREYNAGNDQCSEWFDPLGEATNDLDVVNASSLYRVLIFERTNGSVGANYLYHAGVAGGSVRLFAQGKPIPLLIDTNSDGICDAINSTALPQEDRPVVLSLSAVTPRGNAFYAAAADFDAPEHIAADWCVAGTATSQPNALCPVTEMRRVIPQWLDSAPPAIYAFAPTNGGDGPCAGYTWEVLPSVGEGWACFAASAQDNIGNAGISPPIRVCFDDDVGEPQGCRNPEMDPPPSCTDGCAWPDDLPPNTMLRRR